MADGDIHMVIPNYALPYVPVTGGAPGTQREDTPGRLARSEDGARAPDDTVPSREGRGQSTSPGSHRRGSAGRIS